MIIINLMHAKYRRISNSKPFTKFVATLVLGSRPRQGFAKVWANSEARESHFMLSGV